MGEELGEQKRKKETHIKVKQLNNWKKKGCVKVMQRLSPTPSHQQTNPVLRQQLLWRDWPTQVPSRAFRGVKCPFVSAVPTMFPFSPPSTFLLVPQSEQQGTGCCCASTTQWQLQRRSCQHCFTCTSNAQHPMGCYKGNSTPVNPRNTNKSVREMLSV